MLPDDPYFDAKDPGSDFPPGLANVLQRSVGCEKAVWASGTFPAPAGTSLPWGGGRLVFFRATLGADSTITVDDAIDWRNRAIMVFGGFYDDAADLPGSGTEPVAQPDYAYWLSQALGVERECLNGYLGGSRSLKVLVLVSSDIRLEADGTTGELKMVGNGTPVALYPCLWIFASDQFPTRT